MKTMKIFEPAMCCPTGLCGIGVDPELLRISTVLDTLHQNGIEVQRFNLTSAPEEFIKNSAVAACLQKFGPDKLPVTLVDDFIVIAGCYPTNEEITDWLGLPEHLLETGCTGKDNAGGCCCGEASSDEGCGSNDGCTDTIDTECCCSDSQEVCCPSDNSEPQVSESGCGCSKGCC